MGFFLFYFHTFTSLLLIAFRMVREDNVFTPVCLCTRGGGGTPAIWFLVSGPFWGRGGTSWSLLPGPFPGEVEEYPRVLSLVLPKVLSSGAGGEGGYSLVLSLVLSKVLSSRGVSLSHVTGPVQSPVPGPVQGGTPGHEYPLVTKIGYSFQPEWGYLPPARIGVPSQSGKGTV